MTPATPNYFIRISPKNWEKGKLQARNFNIDGQTFLFTGKVYREIPSGIGTFSLSETTKIVTCIRCKGFYKGVNILPGTALFSIDNDRGYHYKKQIIIEKRVHIKDLMREHLAYWKEEMALQSIK